MSDVLIRKTGAAGHITLNRPDALNALTHQMCLDMEGALDAWAHDPDVACVVIDAAGERAFCAGGDIVNMYTHGKAGDPEPARQFWRDEYRLNAKIATYPKPFVAFTHGFTMGGGVGVSAHGSHRVVTDSTQFAMPECAIGLIPDVGGTYLLSRLPGALGLYAGLTGARFGPADCVAFGLADFYLDEAAFWTMRDQILETGDVDLLTSSDTHPTLDVAGINAVFDQNTVEEIADALKTASGPWVARAQKGFSHGSPLSQKLTIRLIEMAKAGDVVDALRNEYRAVSWSLDPDGEFIEGVRAALVDKDRNPQWRYPSLSDVPADLIARLDKPATGGDFEFKENWS
ncbi:MAG: enoyl-CoA hydratase/isomerase family protein [Pseudomonadota bacterium]